MSLTTSTGTPTPLDYLRSLLNKSTDGNSAAGQVGTGNTTGVGVTADVAHAPEATKAAVLSNMMASIDAFMPAKSEDDVDVMVATATAKLKETMNKSQAAQIKVTEEQKREQAKEAEKKYKDADQKIQDAKYAASHASIWDKIKLAFEYVGAIMSILAGIATMVAGLATGVAAGPALLGGALLIESGLLMLTLAVDETVQQATAKDGQPGTGMFAMAFTAIVKDAGLDPNSGEGASIVKWGTFAVQTYLMVASLATGVIGGIVAPEATLSDFMEIGEGLMDATRGVEEVGEGAGDAMKVESDVERGASEAADVVENAQSNISALAEKVSGKAQEIGSTVKSFAKDPGKIADKAAELGQKALDKAEDLGQKALSKAQDMGRSAVDDAKSLAQAPGKIADRVQGMARSVADDVEEIAKDPSKIFDLAKETASDAKTALKASKPVKFAQQVNDTTNSVVNTAGDLGKSQANLEASQDQSDADGLRADAKTFEAMNKVLDEFIDIALGQLKKSSQQLNAVLDSVVDSKKDLSDSLNQFRFSA